VKKIQAQATKLGVDPVTAGQMVEEREVAKARKTHFQAPGTYDIWSDSQVPQPVAQVLSKKRRRVASAISSETREAHVMTTIPTLPLPLPAESVNPRMDDVLDVAAVTALQYELDEEAEKAANDTYKSVAKYHHASLIFEGQDALDELLEDNDDDEESEEVSEETQAAIAKAQQKREPKVPLKPGAKKRLLEAARERRRARAVARQEKQFAAFDEIASQLEAEKKERAARGKRRRLAAERIAAAKAPGAGHNRFEEADAHVVLPRRVAQNAGRLVRVAATPYAVRDMMKSLQRRGRMESQRLHTIKDIRVTYNVK
jgi:hypothetical protein